MITDYITISEKLRKKAGGGFMVWIGKNTQLKGNGRIVNIKFNSRNRNYIIEYIEFGGKRPKIIKMTAGKRIIEALGIIHGIKLNNNVNILPSKEIDIKLKDVIITIGYEGKTKKYTAYIKYEPKEKKKNTIYEVELNGKVNIKKFIKLYHYDSDVLKHFIENE
jgi:hypothetical protein